MFSTLLCRNESESIKIIVEYISYKLSVTLPTISKKLVGIDSRLEVLNGYIGEELGKAIFIGIFESPKWIAEFLKAKGGSLLDMIE